MRKKKRPATRAGSKKVNLSMNRSYTKSNKPARKITVRVFWFQPFPTRAMLFPNYRVIGLDAPYNYGLVKLLKGAFGFFRSQALDRSQLIYAAGGWLDSEGVWFCEESVWPGVRAILITAGVSVEEVR